MRARALIASIIGTTVVAGALIGAPAASATNLSDVLDNPAYWQPGNQADIIQWVNMSYGSSHPRYSTHRIDVLLDDGGRPLDGVTYLKLTTNFSAISGTTSQDEFVSGVRLPAGVRVADSDATPIFCRIAPNALFADGNVPFQMVADSSCRQGVKDVGNNTFAVNDKVLNRGDVWEVYVPVVSSRAISPSEGAGAAVSFVVTNANKDATEPSVAEATNLLTIGAPSTSSTSSTASGAAAGAPASAKAKVGARCAKSGARSAGLTCVKVKGKLVWKRR